MTTLVRLSHLPPPLSHLSTNPLSTGYVSKFIFETAKISQLFCHQIIWNMKANCYKDDVAEIVRNTHSPLLPVVVVMAF